MIKDSRWDFLGLAGIEFSYIKPSSKGPLLLMLHGWLDNAASFESLIHELAADFSGFSVDLPGHGHSRPFESKAYHMSDVLLKIKELIDFLDSDVVLVGHSLGAGLSTLLAATGHPKIKGLVLIDAVGLMAEPIEKSPARLKRALNLKSPIISYYLSQEEAINKRVLKTGVSKQIATALAKRGLEESTRGYFWSHDRAWLRPSPYYYPEEAMQCFVSEISCPTLVIEGEGGLIESRKEFKARVGFLKQKEVFRIAGGHYPHAHHPKEVAVVLKMFIKRYFHES